MSQRLHLGLILPSVHKETWAYVGICGLGKWGLEAMAISSKREGDFGDCAVNILPVNILQTIKGKRVYIIHWS